MIHIGGHSLRYANVFITMLDTTISVFVFGQYYAKSNLLWKSFRNFSKQFATAFSQPDVFIIGHHLSVLLLAIQWLNTAYKYGSNH